MMTSIVYPYKLMHTHGVRSRSRYFHGDHKKCRQYVTIFCFQIFFSDTDLKLNICFLFIFYIYANHNHVINQRPHPVDRVASVSYFGSTQLITNNRYISVYTHKRRS
jgi:hypothetical protein